MDEPFVRSDSTLRTALITGRETLYTGMNGQLVERLFLATGQRVIFKPLTNEGQLGREAWVYRHLLPALPPIYPRLLAWSGDGATGRGLPSDTPDTDLDGGGLASKAGDAETADNACWCLFEDLGTLSHVFDVEAASALIPMIAQWHALPTAGLSDAPLLGPKPAIVHLLREVLASEATLQHALSGLPAGREGLKRVLAPLRNGDALPESWTWQVLSHGDLHLGNYALLANGELKVLDWEHAHLNSPYWDLYHVLDLSHPVFPKALDASTREWLLDLYASESVARGIKPLPVGWKRDYARYSAVFSLWLLLLIEKDLASLAKGLTLPGGWSLEQLHRQRSETLGSFAQCAEMLD